MSDVLILYLLTRGDAIQHAFGIISAALAVLAIVSGVVWMASNDAAHTAWNGDSTRNFYSELRTTASTWIKVFLGLSAVFLIVSSAIPTGKDVAIIAGGKFAIDMSRSPEVAEITSAVKDRILRELKSDTETEKPKQGK